MKETQRKIREKNVSAGDSETKRGKRRFEPGETVDRSGVYEAFHVHHRITHEVTLIAGQHFPPCSRCKEGVRFQFLKAKPSLNSTNAPIVHVIGVFMPEAA